MMPEPESQLEPQLEAQSMMLSDCVVSSGPEKSLNISTAQTNSHSVPSPEELFASFDIGVGGLHRTLPPDLFDGFPLRVNVDTGQGGGGRSLVAARPIQINEVVLTTKPFSLVILPTQRKRFCAVCLSRVPGREPTQQPGPMPKFRSCSGGCGWAVYCSDVCESSVPASWHRQFECRGARSIANAKAMDDTKALARLILQTLLRGTYLQGDSQRDWEDGILLLESHAAHRNEAQQREDQVYVNLIRTALRAHNTGSSTVTADNAGRTRFEFERVPKLQQMLASLVCAVRCNNFGVFEGVGDSGTAQGRGVSIAQAVYPAASFFNHSCSPNVTRSTEGQQLIFRASRSIEEGEALCIMYGELAKKSYLERQRHLRELYSFDCKCQRCVEETERSSGKHRRRQSARKQQHTRGSDQQRKSPVTD